MTTQRTFKQRVRARMAKTGESYTAARRQLIDGGDRPETDPAPWTPPVSDEAVRAATGHGWDHWLRTLDEAGAMAIDHPAIVTMLLERGVEHWWAQSVTVGYERARGRRLPGQGPDGFQVGVSRTVDVPVGDLYAAIVDEDARRRWAPDAQLRLRTKQQDRSARFDWEDGATRIHAYVEAKGPWRSTITVQHVKLPDVDSAEAMREYWRGRLTTLKVGLEGAAVT